MKLLKIIGGSLVAFLVILLVAYFILPSEAHVERSIVINKSQEDLFDYLNNFENFNDWSPWARMDPEAVYTYEGPLSGVGARMSWVSEHPNVGVGAQEIIVSEPNNLITVRMEFEGFTGDNTASFILEQEGDGSTRVTWTYDAKEVTGAMRYFIPGMDRMLGSSYDDGLATLRETIESDMGSIREPQAVPDETEPAGNQ